MSEQRRRRRRRRRGGGKQPQQAAAAAPKDTGSAAPEAAGERTPGRSKRRRRRRGGGRREQAAPRTLEDVVREVRGPRPERLTADPDGTTLDEVIGELQSVWGVPQYPQEYRITLKVAEDRSTAGNGRAAERGPNGITRERAPAAPRVAPAASGSGDGPTREQAPRRRRRSRRGRRRGKPKGGGS
jgi:hypothetical protein